MVSFFQLGTERRGCETRLAPDRTGYELVLTDEHGRAHIETFDTLPKLLSREHELLCAWLAQGWTHQGMYPSRFRRAMEAQQKAHG
jgi:hypothetical protein